MTSPGTHSTASIRLYTGDFNSQRRSTEPKVGGSKPLGRITYGFYTIRGSGINKHPNDGLDSAPCSEGPSQADGKGRSTGDTSESHSAGDTFSTHGTG